MSKKHYRKKRNNKKQQVLKICHHDSLIPSYKKNAKDILYILENLRPEDKEEIKIHFGEDYIQKYLKEIMQYKGRFIMGYTKKDKTPVCIGGCSQSENGIGIVWLLSTNEIKNHQYCILRNIKHEIEQYIKKYWILCNVIFQKNYLAKNWLKKFGFKFENPFGIKTPDGFEFFYKKKEMRGLNNANSAAVS